MDHGGVGLFWEEDGEKEGEGLNNARWNFCPGRGQVTWSVCVLAGLT